MHFSAYCFEKNAWEDYICKTFRRFSQLSFFSPGGIMASADEKVFIDQESWDRTALRQLCTLDSIKLWTKLEGIKFWTKFIF